MGAVEYEVLEGDEWKVVEFERPKSCECGWLFPVDWSIKILGERPRVTHVGFKCPSCGKTPPTLGMLYKSEQFSDEQIEQYRRRGLIR